MSNVTNIALLIDTLKSPTVALLSSTASAAPAQVPCFIYGDRLAMDLVFLEGNQTASWNGEAGKQVTVYIGQPGEGALAYSQNFTNVVGYGYTGSISLATNELTASLLGERYITPQMVVTVTDIPTSVTKTYLYSDTIIYNNLLAGFGLPTDLPSYYTKTEIDILIDEHITAWTGSTMAGRGLYRDGATNRIGFYADVNYPTGSVPYAKNSASIGMQSNFYFDGNALHAPRYIGLVDTASHAENAAGWFQNGTSTYTTQPYIGIGTNIPRSQFDLVNPTGDGVFYIGSPDGLTNLTLYSRQTPLPVYIDFNHGSSSAGRLVANDDIFGMYSRTANRGYLGFSTKSGSVDVMRMVITNAGNVGIGTSYPEHKLEVAGNIFASSITASVKGTASYAISASWAPNAGLVTGATYPITSSWARTASYFSGSITNAISASYALTASYAWVSKATQYVQGVNVDGPVDSSSYAYSSSYAVTASYVSGSVGSSATASYAYTASYILSASYININIQKLFTTASLFASQSMFAVSASWASSSISASYAPFIHPYQASGSWASSSISASYAKSASYAPQVYQLNTVSSSFASSSISASYAPAPVSCSYSLTASFASTWDSSSLLHYVESLLRSSTYYFTATSSNVPSYRNMQDSNLNSAVTVVANSCSNATYPFNFITTVGYPGTTVIPEGLYQVDFRARKIGVPNSVALTPEIYIINSSGSVYYEFGVGTITPNLSTTTTRYEVNILVENPVTCSVTDRIALRLKATSTGAPTVEIDCEGNALSHFNTPIALTEYITAFNAVSASYALTASYAVSASYAISSSYSYYPVIPITVNAGTTASLLSQTSSVNDALFVQYMLKDTGANRRAGNIVAMYTTNSVNWYETCTTDFGNTDNIIFNVAESASFVKVICINNSGQTYTVKYHVDSI